MNLTNNLKYHSFLHFLLSIRKTYSKFKSLLLGQHYYENLDHQ